MKTTIFLRILLATLLPLILVFVLVISTINNIVYMHGRDFAREAAHMASRQAARQISDQLSSMSRLLTVSSRSLSQLDYSQADAQKRAEDGQKRLIMLDPAVFNIQMGFEPFVFNNGDRYHRTLYRDSHGAIIEDRGLGGPAIDDPESAPWYHYPLNTGEAYLNLSDAHRMPDGGNMAFVAMSQPIIQGGKAIGVVGLHVPYRDLFDLETLKIADDETIFLLSDAGMVLYSPHPDDVGRNILEYSFTGSERLRAALLGGTGLVEEMATPFAQGDSLVALYPIRIEAEQYSYLFISVPLDNLYGATQSSIQMIISTSILGALLLAFSVFVATRNIVRPIRQLTVNFNKVAGGDLDLDLAMEEGTDGRPADGAEDDEDDWSDHDDDEDSAWDMEREEDDDDYDDDEEDDSPEAAESLPRANARSSSVVEIDILQSALKKMLAQISQAHELSLKAAEERLEKEKVIASSQAKSRFFASMSHEIRTPMNAILGISEILLHDDALAGDHRKYVNDIKLSSESLLIIINDILDLSKLESGKMALSPVDFDLTGLLGNITSMARYLAEDKGLQFIPDFADDLPACLYGDDVRLKQVLLNLLSNAIKFTPEGSVRLKVYVDDHDFLRLVISDTGIGIKPEDLNRLFEPFKRMDTTKNREIQGTGLGLSISKSLVELMGGRIELKSQYGQGSAFTIIIPKVLGDAAKCLGANEEREAMIYSQALKVLVVDDNDLNRTVASGLLKTIHGITADTAASGREALEKVQAKDYHLIFMDHMMPEMDGVETTGLIRAMGGRFNTVPIVALTANAVVGTREMLMAAGMNDFLAKPILKKELSDILYRWAPPQMRLKVREKTPKAAAQKDAPPPPPPPKPIIPAEDEDGQYTDFLIKMGAVEEIDLAVALAAMGGQVDIFHELMELLAEKIPEMTELLTGLLEAGDLKAFSIHVHGMKSSLASAGALNLSALAKDMEAASAEGDGQFCRQSLPPFTERLAALGRQLNEVYGHSH